MIKSIYALNKSPFRHISHLNSFDFWFS